MTTTISSKGHLVLPAELRQLDRIEAGQEFDIERFGRAELLARLRATGKAMPIKDSLTAATALTYGLTVATRGRGDLANAGVRVVEVFVE